MFAEDFLFRTRNLLSRNCARDFMTCTFNDSQTSRFSDAANIGVHPIKSIEKTFFNFGSILSPPAFFCFSALSPKLLTVPAAKRNGFLLFSGLVSLGVLVETTIPCSLLLGIFGHFGYTWVAVKLPPAIFFFLFFFFFLIRVLNSGKP